jgi:predicted transcriptional regulator
MARQDDQVLELEIRRTIYEAVKKYAGCHLREIQRRCKLPMGTVRYHLNYLARHGLILGESTGNKLRYYPQEFSPKHTVLLGHLRQQSMRRIILIILSEKNPPHEKIVEALRLSPSTVTWHLKKLEDAKVVRAQKKGRTKTYSLAVEQNEITNLLITYQESFLDRMVDNLLDILE